MAAPCRSVPPQWWSQEPPTTAGLAAAAGSAVKRCRCAGLCIVGRPPTMVVLWWEPPTIGTPAVWSPQGYYRCTAVRAHDTCWGRLHTADAALTTPPRHWSPGSTLFWCVAFTADGGLTCVPTAAHRAACLGHHLAAQGASPRPGLRRCGRRGAAPPQGARGVGWRPAKRATWSWRS